MSTSTLYDNIPKLFGLLVRQIQQANSLNRNHLAVDAENLFCIILNTAFNWKLRNANKKKSKDTIDLESTEQKLCVQVTSNRNYQTKLDRTLKRFNSSNKGFEKLVVIFITNSLPSSITTNGKTFTIEYEVFETESLYREIYTASLEHEKLQKINDALEAFTRPFFFKKYKVKKKTTLIGLPEVNTPAKADHFHIDRNELVTRLYEYAQKGNGLIIGGPGIGKSFIIEQLLQLCWQRELPCYVILVNELFGGTDKDIRKALSIPKGNWLETLRLNWLNQPSKALLIFDGFDTAKDETVIHDVLFQIQEAVKILSPNWSILASVRSYDASKSQRLIQLFPHQDATRAISCRSFEIQELTHTELQGFLNTTPQLLAAYEKSTTALQRLLFIPYFLVLFTDVVKGTATSLNTLFEVQNEEQLLEVYWQRKVLANTAADMLSEKLTKEIVKSQRLSCKRGDVITGSDILTYERLLSMGILSEGAATRQHVSFTHNILLEYAVSIYCMPEEADEVVDYIEANFRLAFTFRQSFVYFYYRLWKVDNQRFWEHYFKIRLQYVPLFKLFHQTVLNYVLGSLYTSVEQLAPVINLLPKGDRDIGIRKLLEGIRFLKKQPFNEIDDEVLITLTRQLSTTYAWELGFLLNRAISEIGKWQQTQRWDTLFQVAQLYCEWFLKERNVESQKQRVNNTAGGWAVGNICQTFQVNPPAAFYLIEKVLDILQEEDFPLRFFQELEMHITFLFETDSQIGSAIFKRLYLHNETSSKETRLGNSEIMAFRSNRRQDFRMVHHRLEDRYKELLEINAKPAIALGLEILNETSPFRSINDKKWSYPIRFNHMPAVILSDYSFEDFALEKESGPLSLLGDILKYLNNLTSVENNQKANELVGLFANAKPARTWRHLIQFIGQHPELMKKWGLQLMQNESIIICDETTQAAAEMLKNLWPFLTSVQKGEVEQIIIQLQHNTSFNERYEFFKNRIKRFLGVIPQEDITLEETKEFLTTHGTSNNRPLIKYSGLQSYIETEEEKLSSTGVDKEVEAEIIAYQLIQELKIFLQDFMNQHDKKPTTEQLEVSIPAAKQLFNLTQKQTFNDKLLNHCDNTVSDIIELTSRNSKTLEKEDWNFVSQVALYYVNAPNYTPSEYEEGTKEGKTQGYYDSPQIKATNTLVRMLCSDKTNQIAPVLMKLLSDNSKTVRHQATPSLNYFYHYHRAIVRKENLEMY